MPGVVGAQSQPGSAIISQTAPEPYHPITATERINWVTSGVIGRPSILAAVASDVTQTWWDTPPEWGRSWRGVGLRFGEREIDAILSNGLEAGLGALWSEDPRYIRSNRRGLAPRLRYAVTTVFSAPRRNGRMAPAWGRYAGNTLNNVIENAWLPPSQRTWESTALRAGSGMLGRLASNLWYEFEPDIRKLLLHRRSSPQDAGGLMVHD